MSQSQAVRSVNPFELLGEDDSAEGALPVIKPTPKAAPAPAAAAAPKKDTRPPRQQNGNGAPRAPRAPRAPAGEDQGATQGETFDHRKNRPAATRGTGATRGGRGVRRGAGAAAHGGSDRKSGGHVDSHKKVEQGWGHEDGAAELADEKAGLADATADAQAAAASGVNTPAVEKEEPKAAPVDEKKEETKKSAEEEEEDNTQSYTEYLASKAAAVIDGVTQLTKRVVGDWEGGGEVVKKEEEALFAAKEKERKAAKARKEKSRIEIDGQFARDGPAPTRGGRGGARGSGEGRGRGGFERRGGAPRGEGAPRGDRPTRGAPRGGRGGASNASRNTPAINLADASAFPSLS